jgi:hypothetical protein
MLVPNRGEILISKLQRSSIPVQNRGEILFPFRTAEILFPFRTAEKYYSHSKPQRTAEKYYSRSKPSLQIFDKLIN